MSAPDSYSLAIHGGAASRLPQHANYAATVETSLRAILACGGELLADGAAALDTVVACVRALEDDPLYNAGRGAVPTAAGSHELDAAVMDGATLAAGAVGCVENMANPVLVARLVMEHSPHVLLAGSGAVRFARSFGIAPVADDFFHRVPTPAVDNGDTVGAVARDRHGNLAAATSTGGIRGKLPGRIGDSPLIGAGTWADNAGCAVSCTGHGEDFIRTALAAYLGWLVESGLGVADAARRAVERLVERIDGDGGLIVVDRLGHIAAAQSSRYLLCGWIEHGGAAQAALQAPLRVTRR